jgi:hypothetical protein
LCDAATSALGQGLPCDYVGSTSGVLQIADDFATSPNWAALGQLRTSTALQHFHGLPVSSSAMENMSAETLMPMVFAVFG